MSSSLIKSYLEKKIIMTKPIKIFFKDQHVGTLKKPENDMWYVFGDYEEMESSLANDFNENMRNQNFKYNYINLTGELIRWTEDDVKINDGLALGIDPEGFFNFRMITSKETLESLMGNDR